MPLLRSTVLALFGLILLPAAPAGAQLVPRPTPLTKEGSDGRYLLDGTWELRRGSSGSWKRVTVPNAWNAGDYSSSSQAGSVVWYRRNFRVPDSGKDKAWILRFEGARYRTTVWLNGRQVGTHTGAYLPFEMRLFGASPSGTNRLLVKVDNRRQKTDLPPSVVTREGQPGGGWWNYGGLTRSVYLRKVDRVDIGEGVQVRPELPCRTCPATMRFTVPVRSYASKAARFKVSARFGTQTVKLGAARLAPGQTRQFTGQVKVSAPHLWSPPDPFLYPVEITAAGGGGRAGYKLMSGIRSLTISGGRLQLNHLPTNFRGGFFHEDDPVKGAAIDHAWVDAFVARAKAMGVTMLRTHYPMNPYLFEAADREGLLIWSEIPMYEMPTSTLRKPSVRKAAEEQLRTNILANGNHPSVFVWSIGNELNSAPTQYETAYVRDAVAVAHSLDRTRPAGMSIQGFPTAGCQSAYAPLDLIGVGTYFGWYPGPNGSTADRELLPSFLDELRACYPGKALAITESGGEANRSGPAEERGTYEYQAELHDYTLGVFATKPWLSGATVMLQAFRARPGWSGGNPYPDPPVHEKGVLDLQGNPKPAAQVVSDWFHRTQQYDLPEGQQ
ncbi:MAG: beta-glucuronidase [Thermoleophilales bacterium]|nr:beta-glucuronidase [Thermoleophilales bacterium]